MFKFLLLIGSVAALHIAHEGSPVALRSLHRDQLAFASNALETNCKVTVDTKTQTLHLKSSIGQFTVKGGMVIDKDGKQSDAPPKALICLGNEHAPSDGPALFFAASGASYLYANHGQGAPIDFFMNKHCWAKNNKVQYYLWLGNPQDDAGFMSQKDADALPCKDGSAGNHYFVIAGMRQLLMEKQNSWIISMDISDTFFTKTMAHKNLLSKFLDDRFDFIGGATGGGTEVFINGAILAYKKSKWATDFAAEWFKNRCGSMNQLGMWASLFKIWQRDEVGGFDYSKGKMSSYYGGARAYARKHSKALLKDDKQKAAMDSWVKNGKLPIALHYPHVLVHANAGAGGVDGIAWRADTDRSHEPFVCHNTMDRHSFSSCYAKMSMCVDPEQCKC